MDHETPRNQGQNSELIEPEFHKPVNTTPIHEVHPMPVLSLDLGRDLEVFQVRSHVTAEELEMRIHEVSRPFAGNEATDLFSRDGDQWIVYRVDGIFKGLEAAVRTTPELATC